MPRAPRIEPNQIQETVTPRVQDTTRPSAQAFGGGDGQVFQAAGDLAKTAMDLRQRAISTEVKNAEPQLTQLQGMIEAKMKTMTQKNALESDKFVSEEWKKGTAEILKGYDDQEIKDHVGRVADLKHSKLLSKAYNHTATEFMKYEEGTQKAFVASAQSDAIEGYDNPLEIKESLVKQVESIRQFSQARGLGAEAEKVAVETAVSQTHLKVINRMINEGKDQMADGYLKRIEKNLNGEDVTTAKGLVEEATSLGLAQRETDKIIAGSANMTMALETARNIDDPKHREKTVSLVKERYGDQKKAKDQLTENLHVTAADFLDKTPDISLYQTQHAADWAQFSVAQRKSLAAYAKAKRSGDDIATDPNVYYNLVNMASGPTDLKNKFMKLNLVDPKYLSKLKEADRNKFIDWQADMRKGKGDLKELASARTNKDIVDGILRQNEIDPKTDNAKDLTRINKFRETLDEKLRQWQDDSGKKATQEQVEDIANDLMIKVTTDRNTFWWNDEKHLFEINPSDKIDVRYDDIPESARIKIEAAYKKFGMDYTEDDILEAYTKKLSGVVSGQ